MKATTAHPPRISPLKPISVIYYHQLPTMKRKELCKQQNGREENGLLSLGAPNSVPLKREAEALRGALYRAATHTYQWNQQRIDR